MTQARANRECLTAYEEAGFPEPSHKPFDISFDFCRKLRLFECPGGLLGVRQCFENYGLDFELVGTFELDKRHKAYYEHLGFTPAQLAKSLGPAADITKLDPKDTAVLPDADLWGGGLPCQHSCPGGTPEGPDHRTFKVVQAGLEQIEELINRGCLKMYWLELGGKCHYSWKNNASVKFIVDKFFATRCPTFKHATFQFNVRNSTIEHDRLRWIFQGARKDISGPVPKPIDCGYGDLYGMLNHRLPNVVDEDLTIPEWSNFKDYEKALKTMLANIPQEQEIGLIMSFDVTRKFKGVYDTAVRFNATVGALTTKAVKKW